MLSLPILTAFYIKATKAESRQVQEFAAIDRHYELIAALPQEEQAKVLQSELANIRGELAKHQASMTIWRTRTWPMACALITAGALLSIAALFQTNPGPLQFLLTTIVVLCVAASWLILFVARRTSVSALK